MPQTGPMILRKARDTAKLTREQLEVLMHVSKTTIKAWEYGERMPESSDVARLGEIVKDDSLWPRWMCATDDEYARRHPFMDPPENAIETVTRLGIEVSDVTKMLEPILRDLMDGKIHDQEFASRFVEALKESEAAHRAARERLQKGG